MKITFLGGVLLIPGFASGRTQALRNLLVILIRKDQLAEMSVYLDSPMAISGSDIYCRYSSQHRLSHDHVRD